MNTVRLTSGDELVLDLLEADEGDARLLGRVPVASGDLALMRDETWREGVRAGALAPVDIRRYSMQVVAGERKEQGLNSYTIQLTNGTCSYGQQFSISSLAPVARRTAGQLLQQGALQEGDQYRCLLNQVRSTDQVNEPSGKGKTDNDSAASNESPVRVSKQSEPLQLESASLSDLMKDSEVMPRDSSPLEDESDGSPMPIFMTDDLWQQGLQLARRGGEHESAAMWTGRLMQDTRSPEIFTVVDACIEAEHADEQELSVTFSGDTWARIRQILNQRRSRLNRPHERFVGAVHGHNFLPAANENGQRMCEACAAAQYCGRSTAHASVADFEWFAAVFSQQPWAFTLIHGFNARGEDDWHLYHVHNGSLVPRTIRRLK